MGELRSFLYLVAPAAPGKSEKVSASGSRAAKILQTPLFCPFALDVFAGYVPDYSRPAACMLLGRSMQREQALSLSLQLSFGKRIGAGFSLIRPHRQSTTTYCSTCAPYFLTHDTLVTKTRRIRCDDDHGGVYVPYCLL